MSNARLHPFTVINPGGRGLNKQMSGTLLDAQWATKALNMVFDDSNRLASRLGWTSATATPNGSTTYNQIFEYKPVAPNPNVMIMAGGGKLFQNQSAPVDVTGTVTVSTNNWQFANFNGSVYGIALNNDFVQWPGSGNFVKVVAASGTVPTGNCMFSAWSRLWVTSSDKQTIQYSALFDATRWANADGGGSINMLSVWPTNDEIIAIAPFNNFLIIFGRNNIVIYTDPTGTIHGINPNNITIYDQIAGVGCVARDSVRSVAGQDLVFLSNQGLTSLQRLLVQRSSPVRDISTNVRSYIKYAMSVEDLTAVRSAYVPRYGFYLIVFPTTGIILCFDTKIQLEDATWRCTEWSGFTPASLCCLEDGVTLYQGTLGGLYQYAGLTDNGASITCTYLSGWLDLGPDANNVLKALKLISAIVSLTGQVDITFLWAFDFAQTQNSITKSAFYQSGSQYVADMVNAPTQYGVSQYGTSFGLNEYNVPVFGAGQFYQLGMSVKITNGQVAFQQMQAFAKLGRLF